MRAPAGCCTRPTADKVREAVFDVLGALPQGRAVAAGAGGSGVLAGHAALDLFAGSGALGIEALSRGAASCTFVERDRAALRTLRANLERLGAATGPAPTLASGGEVEASVARARVVAADVGRALQADARDGARYTLVFADPPYDRCAEALSVLAASLGPLLAPAAVIVVETAAETTVDLPWPVVRQKRYGDTQVVFLVAGDKGGREGEGDAYDVAAG